MLTSELETVSGARDEVNEVLHELGTSGTALEVSHAFHSPLMLPAAGAFREVVESVQFGPLKVPLASTVTGKVVEVGSWFGDDHWVKQLSYPVLFMDALEACLTTCLEVESTHRLLELRRFTRQLSSSPHLA